MNTFADVFAVARKRSGLAMAPLAERANLDIAMISRLENGKRHPGVDTITKLIEAMALMEDEDGRQLAVQLYISAGYAPLGWRITGLQYVGGGDA